MANIVKIKNKNGISYKVQIRHQGYKPIYKTFKGKNAREVLKEAKLWADDIELQMGKGTYKEHAQPLDENNPVNRIKTYADLIIIFKEDIAPKRYSYAEKYNCMYDWWIEQVGTFKIGTLQASHLASCKMILATEKILKGKKLVIRSNNTINKYLMCFSAVLTWAVKELEILEYNPMSKIDPMKKPNGRDRTLAENENIKLAEVCKNSGDLLFLFFLLLISTGGRYSEVATLQVESIDFKNSRVHFKNTKNNTNRGIGINRSLLNMLKTYLINNEIESGYIFINKKTNKLYYMRGKLEKAIKEAGLKDFHIHDLRHTFASKNAENGATLLDIAMLLGHKSLVMARRYTHLTLEHTDELARQTAKSFNII